MTRVIDFQGRGHDGRVLMAGGDAEFETPYLRHVGASFKYSDLVESGTSTISDALDLITFPAGTVLHNVKLNLLTPFNAAVALTDFSVKVGYSGNDDAILAAYADLDAAAASAGYIDPDITELGADLYDATKKSLADKLYTSETVVQVIGTATGDDIGDMNAGELAVIFAISRIDAARVQSVS